MINKDIFLDIYNMANENANKLLSSAIILYDNKCFPQSYFLAYTALEEISKSQFAADVYTGFHKANEFQKFYRKHENKINNIEWVYQDVIEVYKYKWIGPDKDDVEEINPKKIHFKKRQASLYVDIDFNKKIIKKPWEEILEKDAKDIIHIVETSLYEIMLMVEHYGHQIGTKGFMK